MSVYDDTPESQWPASPRKRRDIDTVDRHTFQVMRDRFMLECMARRAECWLCGQDIDYHLISGQPRSFELDHALPVSIAPELALSTSNFRPSHAVCNRRRQDGKAVPPTGEPSENW